MWHKYKDHLGSSMIILHRRANHRTSQRYLRSPRKEFSSIMLINRIKHVYMLMFLKIIYFTESTIQTSWYMSQHIQKVLLMFLIQGKMFQYLIEFVLWLLDLPSHSCTSTLNIYLIDSLMLMILYNFNTMLKLLSMKWCIF